MRLRLLARVLAVGVGVWGASGCTIADLFGAPLRCVNDEACPLDATCVDGLCERATPSDAGPRDDSDAGVFDAGNPALLELTVETATQPAGTSVTVERDEQFTLRWSTRDVQDCSITAPVGAVAPNGTLALSLPATGVVSFVLTCTGGGSALTSDPVEVRVASVLDGDLIVLSNADLDAAFGVTTVTGDVIISGASITDVDALAQLTSVGGDFVLRDTEGLNELLLPALTAIEGSLLVSGGDLQLERIDAPALLSIGVDARFEDLPSVEAIELPVLTSVGRDLLVGTLTAPSFPDIFELPSCASLLVARPLPALTTLSLPALQAIGRDLGSHGAVALSALDLPQLETVGGAVLIEGLGDFASERSAVSLPLLQSAISVTVIYAPNVGTVSLPGLLTVETSPAAEQLVATAPFSPSMPSALFHLLRARLSSSCGDELYPHTGDLFIVQLPANTGVGVESLDLSSLRTLDGLLYLLGIAGQSIEFTDLNAAAGVWLEQIFGPAATGVVDFPSLTTVGLDGIQLWDVLGLNTVRFPALANVTGDVVLNPGPQLDVLALPAPTVGEGLRIGSIHPEALLGIGVETVGASLTIESYYPGTDLLGLEELTSIGFEAYLDSDSLQTLDGLSGLTSLGGRLQLGGGIVNTDGLTALETIGGGIICDSYDLVSLDLPVLRSVAGDFGLSLNCGYSAVFPGSLQRVSLPALTSAGSGIEFTDVPLTDLTLGPIGYLAELSLARTALTHLDSLCGVTEVEGDVLLNNNAALVDISGLAALTSIGGLFYLRGSPSLQTCQVTSLVNDALVSSTDFDFALPAACPIAGACP